MAVDGVANVTVGSADWYSSSDGALGANVTFPQSRPTLYTGFFTADGATQSIALLGTKSSITTDAAAFSLSQVGGGGPEQGVPEPGTVLLLGGSLLGLCAGGFRRFVRK